jgi:adenine specific DNA methylase Mod
VRKIGSFLAQLGVTKDEYAEFMNCRLRELHRILRSSGSIFFHCDRNASHIARFLLNEVFGEEMFRAEIIWYYRRWSNDQKNLLPGHQNILFYSKMDGFINLMYILKIIHLLQMLTKSFKSVNEMNLEKRSMGVMGMEKLY